MKMMKEWLKDLNKASGLDYFFSLYKVSPWEMIVMDELKASTMRWVDGVHYIVFLGKDYTVNDILELEETDYFEIYSEVEGLFTTKNIAFLRFLNPNGNDTLHFYSISAPVSIKITDIAQKRNKSEEDIAESLNSMIKKYKGEGKALINNTMFIQQK